MSETLPSKPEIGERRVKENGEFLLPKSEAKSETEVAAEKQELSAAAHQTIEANAGTDNPVERFQAAQEAAEAVPVAPPNRQVIATTLRNNLKQVRRKLPAPQRALSKVIHQPVVRTVSEAAGKSVSRPSGLLGGGLVAFIGSSGYLYLAKHIGFTYNYAVVLLLFVVGFIFGLALELLVWSLTASRRQHHE